MNDQIDTKRVISFYLEESIIAKLDRLAQAQRRNRSTQIAFLIDAADQAASNPSEPCTQEKKA